MKLIRQNVFETNSSSTHALVVLSKDNYNKWKDDKLVIDLYKATKNPIDPVKEIPENAQVTRNEDGSVDYNETHYESMYDLMEEEYDTFDDSCATKEYIEEYAEVEKTELDGRVIMSVYRGERW